MKKSLQAIALVGTVGILILTLMEGILHAIAQFEQEDIQAE